MLERRWNEETITVLAPISSWTRRASLTYAEISPLPSYRFRAAIHEKRKRNGAESS
jgi:hypothetical protein